MKPFRLVAISGSVRRPSRTRALVETIATHVAWSLRVDLAVYDLLDTGRGLGDAHDRMNLPLPAARVVQAIETADALIVGSPVHRGSYAGLFKHLLDFAEPDALAGKPVALAATGSGQSDGRVIEHALRPLFEFLGTRSVPTAVYASDADFQGDVLVAGAVRERALRAARQLVRVLDPPDHAAPFLQRVAPYGQPAPLRSLSGLG